MGCLKDAGYTEQNLRARLTIADLSDLQLRALPLYRDRIRSNATTQDPLAIAIDLFLLQSPISQTESELLFGPKDRAALIDSGLLESNHGLLRSRASIYPVNDRLIVSDHAWPQLFPNAPEAPPADQVMFIGADSRWLARATVRRQNRAALDLCTGSGVHALLAATHSQRVLAVDVNPRAIACTRYNASAQDLSNVEAALGDLYEPARGQRFDLITANPPFVPAPCQTLGFRDGGPSGEEVQRRIVAGLSQHLAPGGIAQVVTEIGEREGESCVDRVRAWLEGAPMDVHMLRLRTFSAESYAIGHAFGEQHDRFFASVRDWHRNLMDHGYTRMVAVLLAFTWSEPWGSWTRSDECAPPLSDCGPEIAALFAREAQSRKPGFREALIGKRVKRSGQIALTDARLLGSANVVDSHATLLGRSLAIAQPLNVAERALLERVGEGTGADELTGKGFDALQSLIRKGLVSAF